MKLYLLRGLPGCGKTTRSAEIMKASGNTVRLNKDLMREMLHLNKWSPKNEDVTHRAVRILARELLLTRNVIVDDTNLNPGVMQGWKDLAKECGAQCEVVDMTDVPIETCVQQDKQRKLMGQRYVGYTVIKNMALRAGLKTFSVGEVVLCDIDGTIANIDHRLHLVKGEKKDWGMFFRNMIHDPVREDVRQMLLGHQANGKTIIYMSGRPDSYVRETTDWLASNGLHHYTVIMRSAADHRPDEIVKPQMLKSHFPDLSVIHEVIDDRPRVIRAWKELGLNVTDVGHGVEF